MADNVPTSAASCNLHDSILHTCACGLGFTRRGWESLLLVGYTPTDPDDAEGALLELRNCSACSSTLARPVASLRDLVRVINAELRDARRVIREQREHHDEHHERDRQVLAFLERLQDCVEHLPHRMSAQPFLDLPEFFAAFATLTREDT